MIYKRYLFLIIEYENPSLLNARNGKQSGVFLYRRQSSVLSGNQIVKVSEVYADNRICSLKMRQLREYRFSKTGLF